MDKSTLWRTVLGELEVSLSKANFTTWFKNTEIVSCEDGSVIVSVPNIFTKEWLEGKYHKQIFNSLKTAIGDLKSVEYKVGAAPKTRLPEPATPVDTVKEALTALEDTPSHSESGLNTKFSFDTFIIGSSNKLAHATCKAVAASPGEIYNPLFIYGASGLGKTHLIQAIANEITSKRPKKKVVYVSCERFLNEFVASIGNRTTGNFKKKYRTPDLLLIDDVQFLSGKEGIQEEFFHTFNALQQHGKQVVLTSDRPPESIISLEDRLLSRFKGGMLADVQPPDFETRTAILHNKALSRGYQLDLEVVDFISKGVQRNVRELEGALNRLIAYCELNNEKPTLEITRNVLSSMFNSKKRDIITAKDIVAIVAAFYDLSLDELMGKRRDREYVVPRQIAMYLMREEGKLSYPKIALGIGKRDHTTALHGVQKIEREIDQNESIRHEIAMIRERLYT